MIRRHRIVTGLLQTNCYIVWSEESSSALVIDPGDNSTSILEFLRTSDLNLRMMVATHGHFDHVLAVDPIRMATKAPFYLHADDLPVLQRVPKTASQFLGISVSRPPSVDYFLEEDEKVGLDDFTFKVIHTPGHSPGSICLSHEGTVFTGDTLFANSIGRTDIQGGNLDMIISSIKNKLFILPDDTDAFPGHGPATTIGRERKTNPFVGESS